MDGERKWDFKTYEKDDEEPSSEMFLFSSFIRCYTKGQPRNIVLEGLPRDAALELFQSRIRHYWVTSRQKFINYFLNSDFEKRCIFLDKVLEHTLKGLLVQLREGTDFYEYMRVHELLLRGMVDEVNDEQLPSNKAIELFDKIATSTVYDHEQIAENYLRDLERLQRENRSKAIQIKVDIFAHKLPEEIRAFEVSPSLAPFYVDFRVAFFAWFFKGIVRTLKQEATVEGI